MFFREKFILTNTQTHQSFLLDKETFKKLVDEDAYLNQNFIDAQIVDDGETLEWPYLPISRFFLESASIYENELASQSTKQFWEAYLNVSEETLLRAQAIPLPECEKIIELPAAREIEGGLYDALKNRRTIRQFHDTSVELQELADILFTTFGKFHNEFGEKYMDIEDTVSFRKTSPSAGGLHPIDAYVFVRKVENLEAGIYFYNCKDHNLRLIKLGDFQSEITHNLMGQTFANGAAFNILTVANLEIVSFKYDHSRAVLLPFLDNGHLVQTALLVATNMRLQTWMTAAICEPYFRKLLNLKQYFVPITFLAIGHGYNEALGPEIREYIESIRSDRLMMGAMACASVKQKVSVEKSREQEDEIEKS